MQDDVFVLAKTNTCLTRRGNSSYTTNILCRKFETNIPAQFHFWEYINRILFAVYDTFQRIADCLALQNSIIVTFTLQNKYLTVNVFCSTLNA